MAHLNSFQDLEEFFIWLNKNSEAYWKITDINRSIYGFQIQQGTKWLKGLKASEISEYERIMGFKFPEVFKLFLKHMNGTDKPTINIYAESGEPYRYSVGFLSYPRDLEVVKAQIAWILESFQITPEAVEQQDIPHIIPIIGHRFLVMDRCEITAVLSMYEDDVILYAPSLPRFLVSEIFHEGNPEKFFDENKYIKMLLKGDISPKFKIKFWLE